jgi:hypothetical protein
MEARERPQTALRTFGAPSVLKNVARSLRLWVAASYSFKKANIREIHRRTILIKQGGLALPSA